MAERKSCLTPSDVRQDSAPRLLLFGGTGSLGTVIRDQFQQQGWCVTIVSRQPVAEDNHVCWNPVVPDRKEVDVSISLHAHGPFEAVCWAQGTNCSDSVYDFCSDTHTTVYQANVLYILNSLHILINERLLQKPARLCVISSIWQQMARQNKLSYCVTKAALKGLVLSAAADLARDGHVINAVLPGVLETPMTRANLSTEQIGRVESATLFGRLTTLQEVASCVFNLCRSEATGITGQFINVDLGYSSVRVV